MMIKNKKIQIVAALIATIWLFFSTTIITQLYNKDIMIKINPEYNIENMDTVQFSFDELYATDSIFNSINILGWAVCPTGVLESEQQVAILLQSSEQSYEISTKSEFRSDLATFFQQRNITITGNYHGFSVDFCPYFVKNGIYDIWIAIQANGEMIGLQKTSYVLKKGSREISVEADYGQILTAGLSQEPVSESSLAYCVDSVERDSEQLTIAGWLYLPQGTSRNVSTLVGITLDNGEQLIYDAATYNRADLISITTEENCTDAGFRIGVPLELIENTSNITLDFYKQVGDTLYHSPTQQTFEIN